MSRHDLIRRVQISIGRQFEERWFVRRGRPQKIIQGSPGVPDQELLQVEIPQRCDRIRIEQRATDRGGGAKPASGATQGRAGGHMLRSRRRGSALRDG